MTADGPTARILVVEDEESLADTVRYNLEREGYAVAVASDGRAALDRFRSESPSLVILDLMLPEMSGLDVCRAIRQRSERAHHHGDREGLGGGQGRRARARRGRLRHEAVLGPRAGLTRAGAPPPGRDACRRAPGGCP